MNTARSSSTLLSRILCLAAIFLLWHPLNSTAGTYTSSAHGTTGTGVSRAGLNAETVTNYATGNCAHCHEQHASVVGSEPAPTGGPGNYLGMANETGITNAEQTLCFYCHGTGTASNNESTGTNDDVQTDIDKIVTDETYYSRHNVYYSDTAHRANETIAQINANKHVECTDCHNPHAAGNTPHTATGNDTAATVLPVTSPLYKATGIEPSYTGMDANWGDDTIGYGSYGAMQTATKEYQICFKCHTKANTDVQTWGDEETDLAFAWTDVGMEFNPNNKSFHPVVSGLSDAGSGSSGLTTSQLIAPWNVNVGSQTMYCSDCHASDSAVAGPHGSGTKWMLAGTNKAWPFAIKTDNGKKAPTTYRTLGTMTDTPGEDGLFCLNCHPDSRSTSINKAHAKSNHSTTACVDCHIRIPHGGRVSRLMAADNNATYTMPARYTSDGAGQNTTGTDEVPFVKEFIKAADGTGYSASNCTTSAGCAGGAGHSTTSIGGEYW
ncbi:MAG: hypothetical protein OEL66_00960 [Desulfobulbaceae bacterium]|nr:hypothetical protein [Desulfobulbaceae bacterium]